MTSPARIAVAVRAQISPWGDLFRPDAIDGLAWVVATSAPTLEDRDLSTLCKLGAWICAFDDAVDTGDLDNEALKLRIAHYDQLVRTRGCPELAFDPIARLLHDVLDDLARAPLSTSLWPLFADQFMASCEAMRWERSAPPQTSLDDYLLHAADSICVKFVVTAAAMLIGEDATLGSLPSLLAAAQHSATVVRIANDVATWSREQTESCAANAMRFTHAANLRARRSRAQHSLGCILDQLTGTPALAAFLSRFTACFVALYARGDLTDIAL